MCLAEELRELLDERRAGQHGGAAGLDRLLLQAPSGPNGPEGRRLLDVRAVADQGDAGMGRSEMANDRQRITPREVQVNEHAAPRRSVAECLVGIRGDGERDPQVRGRRLQLPLKDQIIHDSEDHLLGCGSWLGIGSRQRSARPSEAGRRSALRLALLN